MVAVVLAAGRGSRLGPLTSRRSKAMMPVAGKPMLGRVLDMLSEGGVEHAIIVRHPEDHELVNYFQGSGWASRVQLTCQERRLGMADALECASPLIRRAEPREFVLASCDNLYPKGHVASLVARHRREGLDAALTLMWTSREKATVSAVAALQDGRVVDIIEKPTLAAIPFYDQPGQAISVPSLYVLSPRVLDHLARVLPSSLGERQFPDALRLLIAAWAGVGGQFVADRMTLTKPRDLVEINRHFLRTDPTSVSIRSDMPHDATAFAPVSIEEGVTIGKGCRLGPDVYLERGCSIGANAVVQRSVVMRAACVGAHQVVGEAVISRWGEAR